VHLIPWVFFGFHFIAVSLSLLTHSMLLRSLLVLLAV
jgi:hypothetical protein